MNKYIVRNLVSVTNLGEYCPFFSSSRRLSSPSSLSSNVVVSLPELGHGKHLGKSNVFHSRDISKYDPVSVHRLFVPSLLLLLHGLFLHDPQLFLPLAVSLLVCARHVT
jgi:hypothetical protein